MPRTCGACRACPCPAHGARSPQRRLGAGRAEHRSAVQCSRAGARPCKHTCDRKRARCVQAPPVPRHGTANSVSKLAGRQHAAQRRQPTGLCLRAQSSTHAACCAFAMRSSDACACFLCVSTTRSSSAPYGSTCRASALTDSPVQVCARCRLSGSKCAAGLPRGPPAAVPFGSICPTCAQSETSARTHPRKRTRGVDAWCMQL